VCASKREGDFDDGVARTGEVDWGKDRFHGETMLALRWAARLGRSAASGARTGCISGRVYTYKHRGKSRIGVQFIFALGAGLDLIPPR